MLNGTHILSTFREEVGDGKVERNMVYAGLSLSAVLDS